MKEYRTSMGLWVMVFNTTFNNISVISWRSILLVEETGVPGYRTCKRDEYDNTWHVV